MIPGPHDTRASRAGDIAPLLVDIPTTCRLTGKSRTYIYDHLDQFRSALIGRTRMIDYRSIREWVDRQLAEAGHAPATTPPAPTITPDLIAAAEAVAMSPRAMGDARALALRVLDLAGQDGEAAR
ncbi:putative DNA-binding transcriptional regulator AlpA [Roseospira goensis]|uniref:Putative DNA-binding transcriptional regulator AlpA n=2 Tax=Roseospira goensis TaxID=391922 RepID=A0A7W6S163_9PROT|nr:putative DNA-binding transcriptional regulator AlpA [Roseospira goensis]